MEQKQGKTGKKYQNAKKLALLQAGTIQDV